MANMSDAALALTQLAQEQAVELTALRAEVARLRDAVKRAADWHDRQYKNALEQPTRDGWMMNEHAEEIFALNDALSLPEVK